jgi:hypothetical protein
MDTTIINQLLQEQNITHIPEDIKLITGKKIINHLVSYLLAYVYNNTL